METNESNRHQQIARAVVQRLTPSEAERIHSWLSKLLAIRESNAPMRRKIKHALRVTYANKVIPAVLKVCTTRIRDLAWTDRSWPARIGIAATAGTAVVASSEGAGIAALGGAIGVPLWIVVGAGSTFAAVLLNEIAEARRKPTETTDAGPEVEIPEAEWSLVETQIAPEQRVARTAREAYNQLVALQTIAPAKEQGALRAFAARSRAAISGASHRLRRAVAAGPLRLRRHDQVFVGSMGAALAG